MAPVCCPCLPIHTLLGHRCERDSFFFREPKDSLDRRYGLFHAVRFGFLVGLVCLLEKASLLTAASRCPLGRTRREWAGRPGWGGGKGAVPTAPQSHPEAPARTHMCYACTCVHWNLVCLFFLQGVRGFPGEKGEKGELGFQVTCSAHW